MTMFGLDPQSIAHRAQTSGQPVTVPTLAGSLLRGMIGFTIVSLGGFAPWILAGRWFYRNVGELGLYAACAAAFVALSGVLLHQLVIGPGSLRRFYQVFSLAFLGYAVAWTMGWFAFRGLTGSVVGAIGGIVVMGVILATGFAAHAAIMKIIVVLLITNAAGYFLGEWAHQLISALKEGHASGLVLSSSTRAWASKASWGLLYGLGFGAGIGLAIYSCQSQARLLLNAKPQNGAL